MEEILILTSTFLPNPGANGLITYKIAKELIKRENKVHVIAIKQYQEEIEEETIEGIHILRISKSEYSKLLEKNHHNSKALRKIVVKRRIKNIINLYNFPNFDKKQTKKVLKKAKILINEKKIKKILSVHKPYINVDALISLKRDFPKIETFVLFLDPLDSLTRPKIMPVKVYDYFIKKTMYYISNNIDFVLQPLDKKDSIIEKYSDLRFNYFEYPNFSLVNSPSVENYSNELVFVYAGTLNSQYRNPDVLLKVVKDLKPFFNLKTDIYGKNHELIPQEYKPEVNILGSVSQKEIHLAYQKADLLINISNKGINSIPSKIFELFSYGKPIINFVKEKNDPALPYFEKYPLAYNFFEYEDFHIQFNELRKFIKTNREKSVSQNTLSALYYKNTIEYFVDQLETISER